MRAMKDSGIEWIGQIPQAWQVVRVKHLATQKDSLFLDGDWINSDVITTEGIRYLTSGNVGEGAYKEQGNGHISEETFEKLNCLKAFPGDLMISRLNEPVGRCCIIPEGHPFYVVAVDNVILRPDDGYNKKFIMYCMNTRGYAHATLMAASGTTMVRISRTSLGNLTIPVASVEEQERIAEYLDTKCADIDALIAAKEKTNALLKERRQSIIYEAVTKGPNPNAPMKDSGIEWIGQIPETWLICKIKHFVVDEDGVRIGPFGSALTNRLLENGDYNVYSQANLIAGDFSSTNHTVDEETFIDLKKYEVIADDICVSMMGTIGKCRVVPHTIKKGIMDSHLIKIRLKPYVNPKFFEYVYDKDNSGLCFIQMKRDSKGTIMDGLNSTIVKNLYFPLPSREIQDEIVAYLERKCEELDLAISANEATIQKLKEYRQSIIYEAVTGKIEI